MPFHEGQACDAVIRVLEKREGQVRQDISSPEKNGDPAPIELICRIGTRLFAFEHTGIEPFAGHMKLQAEAARLFDPIKGMLVGKLPPDDYFELVIPAVAMQEKRTRELARIHTALAAWVAKTAPSIKAQPLYDAYSGGIQDVRPPGVPFKVSLFRFSAIPPFPGYFQISPTINIDREVAREHRLRKACDEKFPKLDVWRQDRGARTVLIFEATDYHFTNAQLVFDALARFENTMAGRPDEIYLVSTMIDNPWFVHAMRIDNHTYYQLTEFRQCMTEIDAATLVDLTGR